MSAGEWAQQVCSVLGRYPLLERLLIASLELVVVTAVVLTIIHAARVRSNRVIALLWLAALAKPVVSLVIGAPAPVWNAASLVSTSVPPAASEEAVVTRSLTDTAGGTGHAFSARHASPSTESEGSGANAARAALAAWVAGVLAMATRSAADRWRIRKLLSGASAPPPDIASLYGEAAGSPAGAPPPRLLISPRLDSPAIVGSFSPVVLLPDWMSTESDRERVLWALRHELTHWRHRDPLAGLVRESARVLFFFHPLVWWIGRKWKVATEVACDQALVGSAGEARRYAEQLYQTLTRIHSRRRIMLDSGLFASRTQIGRRIELLLRSRPRRQADRRLPVAVPLLAFSALVFSVGGELALKAEPRDVVVESSERAGGVLATAVSDDDRDLIVNIEGEVSFNDDQSDVVGISRDGSFTVTETRDGIERRLRIVPSDDGRLTYHYEIDGESRPFDGEARVWFSRVMQCIHVDDGRDLVFVYRPDIALEGLLVVREKDGPNVDVRVVAPDDAIEVHTGGDDDISLVLRKHTDEEEVRVWISTSARVVGRSGDRVVFDLGASGAVRITVVEDANKHELEVKPSEDGDREYFYELNGERRPYDDNAKKIFEKYIRVLDGGFELKTRGERI